MKASKKNKLVSMHSYSAEWSCIADSLREIVTERAQMRDEREKLGAEIAQLSIGIDQLRAIVGRVRGAIAMTSTQLNEVGK